MAKNVEQLYSRAKSLKNTHIIINGLENSVSSDTAQLICSAHEYVDITGFDYHTAYSMLELHTRTLKALRHGPPTQSDYVHFSVHNVVPRRLGTRPTVYVHAANLPARVKCSRRCLCSSSTASLHAQLPHLDVEPSTSL